MENSELLKANVNLDSLPFDIQLNILNRLDYQDLDSLGQVNKRLSAISNDNQFWKDKLVRDLTKWKKISSRTYPRELINERNEENDEADYKQIYFKSCPDLLTRQEILKKLETFQTKNLPSSTESPAMNSSFGTQSTSNLTLSTLPMAVLGQIKDFIIKNVNENGFLRRLGGASALFGNSEQLSKMIMFGPGLETTTSCLVTNILWKSEFEACGMIPGKDGYGSGIKLKLANHRPFNLTILYTNVSKIRKANDRHDVSTNRLLLGKWNETTQANEYEVQPQVLEACMDASGFIYVIDNEHLAGLDMTCEESIRVIENYKLELNSLMKEMSKEYPLLILSCNSRDTSREIRSLSCSKIIELLRPYELDREWLVIDCNVLQHQMTEIVSGFEWILNEIDEASFSKTNDHNDNTQ